VISQILWFVKQLSKLYDENAAVVTVFLLQPEAPIGAAALANYADNKMLRKLAYEEIN